MSLEIYLKMFAKILLIVMVSSLLTTTNSIDCDNGFFELENETGNRVCESKFSF